MENIRIEEGKCIIRINRRIYPLNVVLRAVEEFGAYGDITAEDNNTKIIIAPKDAASLEKIGYEFFDCLLNIIQNA